MRTLAPSSLAVLLVAAHPILADHGLAQAPLRRSVVPLAAQPFALHDVRLLDGPFRHAQELCRRYLLSLDQDRLLHNFRLQAGLRSAAKPLGGWEAPSCELRGHSVGHYLSACARMYASTGDRHFKDRVARMVTALGACQQAIGSGYLSAFPESFLDRVEARARVWAPWYTLHKIHAGLIDAYRHCGNDEALGIARRLGEWAEARTARLDEATMQRMLDTEHGGMNDSLAELSAVTGEQRWLELAQRFNHRAILEPAMRGEDRLTGLHANTQVPKFIGAARQYELTGLPRLRTAAEYFWGVVVHERSYAIGGHSDGEMFSPKETLSRALGPNTTETCNTYNMLKLTRHLFTWDPRVELADYYERALINHILASQDPVTGMTCYYVPLRPGSHKTYGTPNDSFWCCTGTGMENHAQYGDSVWFHDGTDRLYVAQFIASELDWKAKGAKIRQETRFPSEQRTRLHFACAEPVRIDLRLRHPAWATAGVRVELNGDRIEAADRPGRWITVDRTFSDGDVLEIEMPFRPRMEAFGDDPRRFAYLDGPVVLCAEIRPDAIPVVVGDEEAALAALRRLAGQPSVFAAAGTAFRAPGGAARVRLEPFWSMHGGRSYTVYWDRVTEAGWAQRQAEAERRLAQERALEARTVDRVVIGDAMSEREHALEGERTSAGTFGGRRWRHATGGGWFSYRVRVASDGPLQLSVTYWGSDSGDRVFDVLVDRQRLATTRLANNHPQRFYDEIYDLPARLVDGKETVTIRFQAHPEAWAGGVFDVRVLGPEAAAAITPDTDGRSDYPIRAVPATDVEVTDSFWRHRLDTNRLVTIPHALQECEETGRFDNFRITGGQKEGKFEGLYFNDSDVYKLVEAIAYSLAEHRDPALEGRADTLIAAIAGAQEPDGYLYTARTLCGDGYMPPGGAQRWSDIGAGHELYCAGHLYEAAVAYWQATGKRALLDVAVKNADLIDRVFGADKRQDPPGHQEIEIGLVKLFRATGHRRYLKLAKFFLDARGRAEGHRLYGEYSQDHAPIVEQHEAVGHAVRAAYMYCGIADVVALTGDEAYSAALDRLWEDVVTRKIYVTGGIGSRGGGEAFGRGHELPNRTAYSETCASIANALWNQRMFLLRGEARYGDVLERVLYNGVLAGVGLSGDRFFYPNPLEEHRGRTRVPWFHCACCPPNVARFVASVPGLVYGQRARTIYVNLFVASTARLRIGDDEVLLQQETRYPWEGSVHLTVQPRTETELTLRIRIPGWARGRPLPSDLYRFADSPTSKLTMKLCGERISIEIIDGFAHVRRRWRPGDTVELELPMPVRRVLAADSVAADRGRVALQRGPIVFCAEGVDQPEGQVLSSMLPDDAEVTAEHRADLLGGVTVLRATARSVTRAADGSPQSGPDVPLTLVPYYAWAHRAEGQMAVWLARDLSAARPRPGPTLAYRSRVNVSRGTGVEALNDQFEPATSIDHSNPFFHWWPRKGTTEWVEYELPEPTRVSEVEVYWFDDTGIGECRLPASWKLLVRVSGEWKEAPNPSPYGTARDTYNRTTFDPVVVEALRLEVRLAERWSAGIHEWRIK